MSHTPGPWQFYEIPHRDGLGIIGPGLEEDEIAHLDDMDRSRAENVANGYLLAAAPDLLAALEAILQTFAWASDDMLREYPDTPQPRAILAARAAIARAKGVS